MVALPELAMTCDSLMLAYTALLGQRQTLQFVCNKCNQLLQRH